MSGRFINGQFHESNPNTQNDEHTPRVIVMRHAHGVTLNPVSDTLLDAEGNDLIFDNEVAARAFLSEAGFSNEDMEFLYFVELDNTISGKGLPVIEGTTEDTGFKGSDYCDEYCSHCEQITYNIPVDHVSLCAHCGAELFPCAACEQENGCQWNSEQSACQRFTHAQRGAL